MPPPPPPPPPHSSPLGTSSKNPTHQIKIERATNTSSETPFTHQPNPTHLRLPGIGSTDLYWKYPKLKYLKFTPSKQPTSNTATATHTPKAQFTISQLSLPGDGGNTHHGLSIALHVAFPELALAANYLAGASTLGPHFSRQPLHHSPPLQTQSLGMNDNCTPPLTTRRNSLATPTTTAAFEKKPAKSLRLISRPCLRPPSQPEDPAQGDHPPRKTPQNPPKNAGPAAPTLQQSAPPRQRGGFCRHEAQRERGKGPYPLRQFNPFKQPTVAEVSRSRAAAPGISSSFQNRCEWWVVLVDTDG